jgi:hypothetical protein
MSSSILYLQKNKALVIILYFLLWNNEHSGKIFYHASFEIGFEERHRKKDGENKQIRNKENTRNREGRRKNILSKMN